MATLSHLLSGLTTRQDNDTEVIVTGISLHSQQVRKGDVFFACAKDTMTRQKHIEQALEKGASAIVIDPTIGDMAALSRSVAIYYVSALQQHLSEIAGRFYQHPSHAMTVLAVTGTNGKTTVAYCVAHCLQQAGRRCGFIGTLGQGELGKLIETGMTTPDPFAIQAVLAELLQQGIKEVIIEASSHALDQGRLDAIAIDTAILTNLSRDHLDYHASLSDYAAAKQRLFTFTSLKNRVVNCQDALGQQLMAMPNQQTVLLTYGVDTTAMLTATDYQVTASGIDFQLHYQQQHYRIHSSLSGQFNMKNILAVIAALLTVAIPIQQAIRLIANCPAVPGRMIRYQMGQSANVIIDYAHTPDALEQVLRTLHAEKHSGATLWCVFGCGGNRDHAKREQMGQIAEHYAQKVVVTSDNPRYEDPISISQDILKGMLRPEEALVELDRKKAIAYSLGEARKNDIILIAGKGHEQYQQYLDDKRPFSDAACVCEYLGIDLPQQQEGLC